MKLVQRTAVALVAAMIAMPAMAADLNANASAAGVGISADAKAPTKHDAKKAIKHRSKAAKAQAKANKENAKADAAAIGK